MLLINKLHTNPFYSQSVAHQPATQASSGKKSLRLGHYSASGSPRGHRIADFVARYDGKRPPLSMTDTRGIAVGVRRDNSINRGNSSMSSVIDFLERIGSDAQWRTASEDEIELALTAANIEMPLREAILAKDVSKFEALLGQTPQLGMMTPPDEEEGEEDEEDEHSGEKPQPKGARDSRFHASLLRS
jgi:hypothetical protein